MAVYQKESGLCHGRGFSSGDANGFLAKFLSWSKRPAVDGSPQNFTADYSTDIITAAGHGYINADSVKLTNAGGALPGGLALATEYYVIYIDSATFKLATTYQNAVDSVAIDITSTGTGTHSVYKLGGGPGWFLREDKTNPTSLTFTADSSTEICTVAAGHNYGTGDKVWVSNSGGTLPGGLVAGTSYYVIYINGTTFKLATTITNAYAGTAINITSNGSGTNSIILVEKYIVICDTASPVVNDIDTGPAGLPPKYIKIGLWNSDSGFIRIQHCLWWNTTKKTGRGLWCGNKVNTSDDADFSYYFYGGAESIFIISRIGTSYSLAYITDLIADTNFDIEGVDKYGIVQSGVTAGSNVTVQLDSGEAANITAGNYYFIFDFDDHSWCDCTKVVSVDGGTDTIVVESITHNYPAGAVIASYAHRFCAGGTGTPAGENMVETAGSKIPYTNAISGYAFNSPGGYCCGAVTAQWASKYVDRLNPNRKGYYGVSEVGIAELYFENISYANQGLLTAYGAHEAYGVLKNILIASIGTMAAGLDGRIDQGLNYIYFITASTVINNGGTYAWLILDTESDS